MPLAIHCIRYKIYKSSNVPFLKSRMSPVYHIIFIPLMLPPVTSTYFINWQVTYRVVDLNLQMKKLLHSTLKDMTKNGFQKCFTDLTSNAKVCYTRVLFCRFVSVFYLIIFFKLQTQPRNLKKATNFFFFFFTFNYKKLKI